MQEEDSETAWRTSYERHWKCLRRNHCAEMSSSCDARCSGGEAARSRRRVHRVVHGSRSGFSLASSGRSHFSRSHSPPGQSAAAESDSDSELWQPMRSVSQVYTDTRLPSSSSSASASASACTSASAAVGSASGQVAEVFVETCAEGGTRILQRIVVRGAGSSSSALIPTSGQCDLRSLQQDANTEAACSRSCSHQQHPSSCGHRHAHHCHHSHRHRHQRDTHCERGRRCRHMHAHSHNSHSSSACESSASASASGSESESCPSCSSATSATSGSDCDTPSESDSDTMRFSTRDAVTLGGRGRCPRRASARPSRASLANVPNGNSALRGQLSAIPEEAASYCSHRSNNSQFTRESPALTSALWVYALSIQYQYHGLPFIQCSFRHNHYLIHNGPFSSMASLPYRLLMPCSQYIVFSFTSSWCFIFSPFDT